MGTITDTWIRDEFPQLTSDPDLCLNAFEVGAIAIPGRPMFLNGSDIISFLDAGDIAFVFALHRVADNAYAPYERIVLTPNGAIAQFKTSCWVEVPELPVKPHVSCGSG